jgi:predicted porin
MRVILVKKTLLVSAVAMAMSGNAMAAEMYGNIRLELRSSDTVTDELDVASGKLVLGSKGSSDLGNGMTLSFQVELEHDQADETGNVTDVDFDKSWVALGGNFGKVIAGRHGDLAGYACGGTDLLTHGSAEACSLGHNTEFDNAVQYRYAGGAFEFGVIVTADGTDADQDTSFGAKFSGENWSVGAVTWENETDQQTQTQIGGTFQLGNIGLGVTLGDNDDGSGDEGGVDFGLYMPLGAGNLAIVVSTMDADDADSADLDWNVGLGDSGYWGIEVNTNDAWDEDRVIGYLGTNF